MPLRWRSRALLILDDLLSKLTTHQIEDAPITAAMNINILQADLFHLDQLVPLFDGYRQFYGQASDPAGARAFLQERLERDESAIFLAVDAGAEASTGLGFVQLYPLFSSVRMRPLWLLNDLFVTPEARRHEVARQLMNRARQFGVETGAAQVILATEKNNHRAKALYDDLGYDLDAELDHYELTL